MEAGKKTCTTKPASTPLGSCGDAWRLRYVGDATDVLDHRPFTSSGKRTPVGLCADANVLVLYPERGQIDWPALLETPFTPGALVSGATIHVIYLSEEDRESLVDRRSISLSMLKKLAVKSQQAFEELVRDAKARGVYETRPKS